MTTIVRREGRTFPEMFDWLETEFPSLPLLPFHRPFSGSQLMRAEELRDETSYTLRLEAPGLDPDRDITVAIEGDVLTVTAQREEQRIEPARSEFRYGTLTRSVTLPKGADTHDLKASYREGILEVRVPIKAEAQAAIQRIPVTR